MTIIDLRPYAKKPPTKSLKEVLDDHIKEVRGVTKIIYDLPDEIWITKSQNYNYFWGSIIEEYNIKVVIKDDTFNS